MKYLPLSILLSLSSVSTYGQNLVENPSFEKGASCDGNSEIIETTDSWIGIAGEPVYYSRSCPVSPEALAYIQAIDLPTAFEGDIFLGLGLDKKGQFVQGVLKEPLKKGVEYKIKAAVRFSNKDCNTPIQELGVLLNDESFETTPSLAMIEDKNALSLQKSSGELIAANGEWQTLETYYVAKGGEDKITLGNFSHQNPSIFGEGKETCSYLYIDNIEMTAFEPVILDEFTTKTKISANQTLVLPIAFEKEAYSLAESKYKLLDILAKQLGKNPELKLEIWGHTDNSRDEVLSIYLSEQRARAISEYLQNKNIAAERIKIIGAGSSQSIAPNNTAEGRQKNERIEIKLQ